MPVRTQIRLDIETQQEAMAGHQSAANDTITR